MRLLRASLHVRGRVPGIKLQAEPNVLDDHVRSANFEPRWKGNF